MNKYNLCGKIFLAALSMVLVSSSFAQTAHEAIDLGLPSGTKWASCNVGATSPEECGGYYAWGETEEKNYYYWDNYMCEETECGTSKDPIYIWNGNKLSTEIAGSKFDVATSKWGSQWRMPSSKQMEELLNECIWTWCDGNQTKYNGTNVKGYIISSKVNNNKIFLPAAGNYYKDKLIYKNEFCLYWSSSQYDGDPFEGENDYTNSNSAIGMDYNYKATYTDLRFYGQTVRPVMNEDIIDCNLSDVPNTSAYYDATSFLCNRTVIHGVDENGSMAVGNPLRRAHLAKIAYRGVNLLNGRRVPETSVTDKFPTIYEDLTIQTETNAYYFQAAKALQYLEYGDGVSAFDRNRVEFAPSDYIQRVNVLKALMETFNIKPDVTGTDNPFPNDAETTALMTANPQKFGYIRKAAELGIITKANTSFRPYDNCLRGEAFVMLYHIMRKIEAGEIDDPNPQDADYFEPLNTTLATISLGLGLQQGNFQHYTKTSFAMSGTVPLSFAHTYNSYNTTLPEVFYGVNDNGETYQPLGDGWSHSYHSFISVPGGFNGSNTRLLVHWGGGSMDVYKSNGSTFVPESYGVYDTYSLVGNEIVITTKTKMEYHFSAQGGSGGGYVFYLSSVKDRNGNTQTLNYETGENGMKRIASVSDGNRSLTFSYKSGTNLLEKVSDPLGRSVRFGYRLNSQTKKYQLNSFTDAESNTTTYGYGDDSKISTSKLLTEIQLPKGNYIRNQYDANRRLAHTENGRNNVPTTQTSVSVAANYGSTVSTQSQVSVSRSGSKTATYKYTYNANNVVTGMTGEEGLYVNNTFADSSHPQFPTAIKSNNTNVSNVTYDNKGNVTRITVSGDGTQTTTMTYDEMNNLTSVTDPMNNTTTYTYDSKGNLTGVSAPEGVTSSITVNSKGLPTQVTNAMGVKTVFEYNSYGNLTKSTLQALNLSSSAYYDKASRLISTTDALNRTTEYEYDRNDNLIRETDPSNHQTTYEYDANGNLTEITNAKGGVTSLSYDNATDWLTSVSFAGSRKEYEYNEDGTLDTYTKPDGTTLSYSYDALGRVTNDGVNDYSYDSKLRLSSVSGNGKTISFTYDGFNRIIGTSGSGHDNSYSYDKNGNCTSINNTTYEYDGLNRLTKVKFSGKTITYTYLKDSQLSKVSYPNGMTTTFDYDAVGRLTNKTTKLSNGTVVASYNFTLDKMGNITEQTTIEPYGDMLLTNEDVSYTYNSGNRIIKAGNINFSFDSNGNTTQRGSEAYTWDKLDRLTKAGSTSMTYDPLGLIASYGDITFTTDPLGIGNVLSDSRSGAQYIYGNGLEARIVNGNISYYVTDVRGSVVAIVDQSGNITHKYQYDEFGKVTKKQEADYNPFQYVGKYGVMALNDHQYYMRARHYDPTIGRFLSEDPIWSTNLYPYADNNPIKGIDPSGLDAISDIENKYYRLLGDINRMYFQERAMTTDTYYATIANLEVNKQRELQEAKKREENIRDYVNRDNPCYNKNKNMYVEKPGKVQNTTTSYVIYGNSVYTTNGHPIAYSNQNSNIIDYGNLNTKSIYGINPLFDKGLVWFESQPDNVKMKMAKELSNYLGLPDPQTVQQAVELVKKVVYN